MTDFDDLKEELKGLRDELDLKMHLASLELKDEWQELEGKWDRFSSRAGLEASAESVGSALGLLGDEIKAGYHRMKEALKD